MGIAPASDALPGFEQLEATPEILRAMMAGLSNEDATWKPAPGRFSIAEVLEHLSHAEAHGFRLRLQAAVEQDDPEWEAYDQVKYAAAGQYSGRDPEDSFAHFEEQRENNLEYLRSLPAGVADRTARHSEIGTVTIGQLLNEWACHDLGHIRQIAELIRARKYYPQMGPFQKYYDLKP